MYGALVFFHSWIRWGVVLSLLVAFARAVAGLVRRTPWSSRDDQALWAFGWMITAQGFVGLTLYFFSPLPRTALQMGKPFLKMGMLRFFALEHPVMMVTAWILSLLGFWLVYRAPADGRHTRAVVLLAIVGALILYAIPWPGPEWGRPLARFERL